MTHSKQQKKVGRPPVIFNPEYIRLAFKYSLLGATDEQFAKLFNVGKSSIDQWKKNYPDFASAINRGRIQADAELATNLFRRGTGYEYSEVTTREIKNENGEILSIETVTITRQMPPDTDACIFWLKNRQPDKWRDKLAVEHSDKPKPSAANSETPAPTSLKATTQGVAKKRQLEKGFDCG